MMVDIYGPFNVTHFQVGDIVRISETAFGDSDEVDDILAQGSLAEVLDIEDDGIGEDYVNESLYSVQVVGANNLYVLVMDSELELVRRPTEPLQA